MPLNYVTYLFAYRYHSFAVLHEAEIMNEND